jgi:hypothetical protein
MADAQLQITIKARNQAKAEFDKLDKQVKNLQGQSGVKGLNKTLGDLDSKFKSVTGVSLGFATAAGAAGAAVSGLIKFMSDAVNETVAYATEIDNMSRLLGLSTEETSRLVQASDDLFISQETLTSGLQAATRKGIDVSIEGLKRLADEYNSLPAGVTRSKFVLDTFGRSGAEMGKLMEQGAAGIDAATAAIADNMIITQKSMADIMNYKRSVDNLNDAWFGLKLTIGQQVIPQLDLLVRQLTPGVDKIEETEIAIFALKEQMVQLAKYGGMAGLSAEEVAEQIAGLEAEIKGLHDELNGVPGAADGATTSLYGLSDIITPVTTYFSDLTTEMLYNQAAAGLDAEASMALAEAMGLIDGETKIVLDALGRLRNSYDTGKISLEEYNAQVAILNERMALIQSKTVTITVRTKYEDQGGLWGQGRNAYIGLSASNRAVGGPVTGGTPYIVGEVGPELFVPNTSGSIVPHNQLAGSTVVNFYYSPAISLTDRTEAETRLVPIIRKALARA